MFKNERAGVFCPPEGYRDYYFYFTFTGELSTSRPSGTDKKTTAY